MKKTYLIFLVGVILIGFLIWRLHQHQPIPSESFSPKTNAVSVAQQHSTPASPVRVTNNDRIPTPEEFAATREERQKKREASIEHSYDEWRTPIEFYGRVVDESNSVIADAQVDFECNDLSPSGTSPYHTKSDSNGSFSIKDIKGKLLGVNVSKEGYYAYDSYGQFFNYAGENQNFVPDAGNPVVFRLRKKGKGELLMITDYPGFAHIAQLKHDGTPVELDLLKSVQVPAGSGQLKLELWRDFSDRSAKVFDWKLQISVPNGGLVQTEEQFAFEAPENGYQPSIVMDMSTNNPNWQGTVKSKYYLQLPDGKYGRIDFDFLPYNGVFTIKSWINPSGSRNLEPAIP